MDPTTTAFGSGFVTVRLGLALTFCCFGIHINIHLGDLIFKFFRLDLDTRQLH